MLGSGPNVNPSIRRLGKFIIKVGSLLLYAQIFARLVLRVGSSFLLYPTLNTSPELRLQELLPCRHPCHAYDIGLGTRVKW